MKFIKKYYLLLLLIITLAGATIYGTYAMFTSSVETNMVNMDTYMNYTFDINGTQELKVSAGSKLRFNAIVKNSMDGKISYGMYYKMISPSTLPSGAIIAQVSDDLTILAKGQLEKGAQTTVPMVIKNTSDSEITVEIGVRTGYATDSQGVDDIIYNEGEIPITSFQTSEEAGNDSCTSTITCTSECTERIENGYRNTYCYCLDSSVVIPTAAETITSLLASNPDTMNNDDPDGNIRYMGSNPNNYVLFNNELWRVIGVFNNKLKIVREDHLPVIFEDNGVTIGGTSNYMTTSVNFFYWNYNGTNNWETSTLKIYLNGTYFNSIEQKSKDLIVEETWYLGGIDEFPTTANELYKRERSSNVYLNNPITVRSFIGLIYPSDLVYSALYRSEINFEQISKNNWLNFFNGHWLISPSSVDGNSVATYLGSGGYRIFIKYIVNENNDDFAKFEGPSVYPTLYLKSTTLIISGDGSKENPYVLSQ